MQKCLQVGDIIIEKSGGSPTQSTGRVSLVSQELLDHAGAVICSNFCTAFRVKKGWNPLYVYYYLQFIYNLGAFFNFEGKTSGIKISNWMQPLLLYQLKILVKASKTIL